MSSRRIVHLRLTWEPATQTLVNSKIGRRGKNSLSERVEASKSLCSLDPRLLV
jgi:hypothetical protein